MQRIYNYMLGDDGRDHHLLTSDFALPHADVVAEYMDRATVRFWTLDWDGIATENYAYRLFRTGEEMDETYEYIDTVQASYATLHLFRRLSKTLGGN